MGGKTVIGWIIYGMIYLGSVLMVYNIYCFIRFAQYIRGRESMGKENSILYIPIVLLVFFLMGYLIIGIFGKPDFIIGGVLFGGSIFVFIMHRVLYGVTQRVIDHEQREAKLMASEESNRAKTRFLASMSHEMRTPMNVILGLDRLALKNPDVSPEVRDQLMKIEVSGTYLLELINNILDLNYMESGELTAKSEEFSLNELMTRLNVIAEEVCTEKGLTYHSFVTDSVSPYYIGDEMLIEQVLLNILDNAVKFTDAPGDVTFSVDRISCQEDTDILEFTVSDTGVGIDPEFLPKVFDLFSREDASTTNRYGGSGLGLAAAKNKAELMDGKLSVSSEKNTGSVFKLSIPMKQGVPADDLPPAEERSEPLAGRRILVAEDIPENAEIVMDLLELQEAESEHAENGQIALDMFSRSSPYYYDAVLMDLRMPVMDGLTATRRIRELDRPDAGTVPILALTANAYESDIRQSIEAGMNVHLTKPVDADELYKALEDTIRNAHIKQGAIPTKIKGDTL